jgi:hypothetical protein
MPARRLRTLAQIPYTLVLAAAARRDALLRARHRIPTLGLSTHLLSTHRLSTLAAMGALAGSPGCVAVGGARNEAPPTLGRQLIDLKAALDAGAISEAEYNSAKSRLLTSNSAPSDRHSGDGNSVQGNSSLGNLSNRNS